MRKSPKRCISQSISQVFTSLPSRVAMVPFSWGLVLWTQENKTKKKSAMLARQVSRKIEKANAAVAGVERRRMQRFGSQKLAKSNKVRAKRPKEKRAGINATARVSRTPRQSNGDVSRTEKKKESRWSTPEDAKVGGAQLVRGHAPCER